MLILLLAACVDEADTVDEGCLDELPGADALGEEPSAFLDRANCWRGYLGLAPLQVDGAVQEAVVAHRDWLEHQGARGGRTAMLEEDAGTDGFTGATPHDRELAAGGVAPDAPAGPSAVWGWVVADPGQAFDRQLDHPWLRDALLQPGVTGVGYAVGTLDDAPFGYLDLVAAVPSGRRTARPVVFPKDGAEGVPVSWTDPHATALDPLYRAEPWGYPVSITVSAQELVPGGFNPFGMSIHSASIRPAGGEPITTVSKLPGPGDAGLPLHTTAVLVPDEPLLPDTTYEVAAEIDAAGGVRWTVATTFRTAP